MMLNRLYGQKDFQYMKLEWFPILYSIVLKGTIFNWDVILCISLQDQVKSAQNSPSGLAQGFHIPAYLVDAFYAFSPFPLMNWNFSSCLGRIHTYCSILWALRFMDFFYHIYDNFLVPLHALIFGFPPPMFSKSVVSSLKENVDWYVFEKYSYIKVYGCQDSPHTLATFILDRFLLK